MTDRPRDWLAQAERDLEQAQASRNDGRHELMRFIMPVKSLFIRVRTSRDRR